MVFQHNSEIYIYVRVGAITLRTLKRERDASVSQPPLFLIVNIELTIYPNTSKSIMEDVLLSSPNIPKPGNEWPSPARAVIRALDRLGFSLSEIRKKTTASRSTIRDILHQEHSRRVRKNRVYRPHLMSIREIRRYIRYIAKDWSTRRLTFEQVKTQLGIQASARTIRRELRHAGYRRYISCPRPYILRQQAKKRLGFALEYRWWGISNWAAHRDGGKKGGD
jgi:transposase